MDMFLEQLPGLGVGGVLAMVIFHFYRVDRKNSLDRWQGQSDALIQVVKENTIAITTLCERIEK
jgi:hypothetical protein